MEIALGVLVLAMIQRARTRAQPERDEKAPPPTSEAAPPLNVPGLVGTVAGAIGAGGIKAGTIGGTVGATKKVASVAVGAAAVAGVSLGFVVVVGLWAVVAIASAIASAVMAPEMATRATWPKLWTTEPGSLPWRAARSMWARLVAARLSGWRVEYQRFPPLDTGYGQLTVRGELDFLVGPLTPPGRPTDDFQFYEFLEWFRARRLEVATEAQGALIGEAQQIAIAYGTGLAHGAAACGASAGKTLNVPPTMGSLAFDGLGIQAPEALERQAYRAPTVPKSRLVGAYLVGVLEGVATSARVAFAEGGAPYLVPGKQETVVAQYLAAWCPYGQLTLDGRVLSGEGSRIEISFASKTLPPSVEASEAEVAAEVARETARIEAEKAAAAPPQVVQTVAKEATREQARGSAGGWRV